MHRLPSEGQSSTPSPLIAMTEMPVTRTGRKMLGRPFFFVRRVTVWPVRPLLRIAFCLCIALANPSTAGTNVYLARTINISDKIVEVGGVPASVRISDVSSDASVVVGMFSRSKVRFDDWRVFRYSKSRGIEDLGQIAKDINTLCVSADGLTIWGSYFVQSEGSRLFRYSEPHGLKDLGTLGIGAITPRATSADGSVVVGSFLYTTTAEKKPLYHAFKYSEARGFEDLGTMGAESAFAHGVSADGAVIVGKVQGANHSGHAFRYSSRDGAKIFSPVGKKGTFATGISNDGAIVGTFFATLDFFWQKYDSHVFFYSKSGEVKKLGTMGGKSAGVVRISPDATQLAGSYTNSARESYVYIATIK